MYGTQDASHIWQLDYVNLICGESGGFRGGKHSAASFHNPNQDVRMAVHGDVFVCLSDDDGLEHIDSLLKSKYTAKDVGTFGLEDSDVKSLLLLNRVFRVGVDQSAQYLDIELDLRHAPLIINESGCTTNTRAVSTRRETAGQIGDIKIGWKSWRIFVVHPITSSHLVDVLMIFVTSMFVKPLEHLWILG